MATNFFGGDFFGGNFFGSSQILVLDTHDGDDRKRKYEEQRQAKERLREQIRVAVYGDDLLVAALEEVAGNGPGPIEDRVDMDAFFAQAELYRIVRERNEAYALMLEEDDEEVLFLNG